MKTLPLFAILSLVSLLVMIVIDHAIGARAEFLNAWSVIERLLGRVPAAGDSMAARSLGPTANLPVYC